MLTFPEISVLEGGVSRYGLSGSWEAAWQQRSQAKLNGHHIYSDKPKGKHGNLSTFWKCSKGDSWHVACLMQRYPHPWSKRSRSHNFQKEVASFYSPKETNCCHFSSIAFSSFVDLLIWIVKAGLDETLCICPHYIMQSKITWAALNEQTYW